MARRRDVLAPARAVAAALAAYQRALEEDLVASFARDHQLRVPPRSSPSTRVAAERLREAVAALPELQKVEAPSAPPPRNPEPTAPARPPEPIAAVDLPRLTRRAATGKIVVLGALAGRQRAEIVAPSLRPHLEWIDTESGGAHAIGNLPQRIRQGRVAALVILDRAVQHKHTEPVVAAARSAGVPVGFAGKGGGASLRRALESIEEQLGSG